MSSMDMPSRMGTSVSEDVNSFHKLSVDPPQCTSRVDGNTVDNIETGLTKFLNIQDDQKQASSFISSNSSLNGVENQDICVEEPQHFDKCLTKSATFPRPVDIKPPAASSMDCKNEGESEDGLIEAENAANAESVNPQPSRSKSLPAPLKLVSAMKGSREKQGTPPRKLNVSWAPDVYDPLPTAVSHVVTSKSQRHHHHHRSSSSSSKKHAKSKQKGSSGKTSRGSSSGSSRGKDKKQQAHRAAYGGGGGSSSSRCLKSLEEEEREERVGGGDFYETGGSVDFDVGSSPDPYCGSSFLKKTVTKLHFSVAEAT